MEAEFHVNLENDGWPWVPWSRGPYRAWKGTYKCLFEFLEDCASNEIYPGNLSILREQETFGNFSSPLFIVSSPPPLNIFFLPQRKPEICPWNKRQDDRWTRLCKNILPPWYNNPRNFYFQHVEELECLPLCRRNRPLLNELFQISDLMALQWLLYFFIMPGNRSTEKKLVIYCGKIRTISRFSFYIFIANRIPRNKNIPLGLLNNSLWHYLLVTTNLSDSLSILLSGQNWLFCLSKSVVETVLQTILHK